MNPPILKQQLQSDLHCDWVGPMPVDAFLDAFLNMEKNLEYKKPTLSDQYFGNMQHYAKETDMHNPFINLVTAAQVAPNLKFLNISNHSDEETRAIKHKPDVIAYDITATQYEIVFELKPGGTIDPFDDLSEEGTQADLENFIWELNAEGHAECRGQFTYYARSWMANQHLNHCFMVWIGDPYARIIRFDRAGAIVTEKFNFRDESGLLLDFLCRFSSASLEVRGKDTTVSIVKDKDEIRLAKEKLADWVPDTTYSLDILKLKIPNGGSDHLQWKQVLVWRPLAEPQCVAGRATRGYPGWDLTDEQLVFVKDSWRVNVENVSKETDILQTLNDAGVRNVPKLICGGDIPNQTTRTQSFASAGWNMGGHPLSFSERKHVRFVCDVVGTRLIDFKSSRECIQAWYDALIAHQDAYQKCKILHRDISLGNILIKPGGGGYLVNWDLAMTLDEIDSGPPSRLGTWQFMSVRLLDNPHKKHTLPHDLEAFFWALLYLPLRYLITSCSLSKGGETISRILHYVFDEIFVHKNHLHTGGANKQTVILQQKHIGDRFYVKDNVPLTKLIENISDIVKSYLLHWYGIKRAVKDISTKKGISLEEAESEYLKENPANLELASHSAMLVLAETALKGQWPTDDSSNDHCDLKHASDAQDIILV